MLRTLLFLLPLSLAQGEYLKIDMSFGGMECASCSTFIQGKFGKNPGIESVNIDNKKHVVQMVLKPGNTVRISQVRDFVQQSGFTPKEAKVTVMGVASVEKGYTNFAITGLNQIIRLRDKDTVTRELISKKAVIEGVWQVITNDGEKLEVIDVDKAARAK